MSDAAKIKEIQSTVAEFFNLEVPDMLGRRRLKKFSWPRQVAMYLCSTMTQSSFPKIARHFDRDHTTIMHAVDKVRDVASRDVLAARDLDWLVRVLSGINPRNPMVGHEYERDLEAEKRAW